MLDISLGDGKENKELFRTLSLPRLKEFHIFCSLNKIETDEAEQFNDFLKRHNRLKRLKLLLRTVLATNLSIIQESLAGLKRLKEFRFQFMVGQGFREEGVSGFQQVLQGMPRLEKLDLDLRARESNSIELLAIMEVINQLKSLKEFRLSLAMTNVDGPTIKKLGAFIREKKIKKIFVGGIIKHSCEECSCEFHGARGQPENPFLGKGFI